MRSGSVPDAFRCKYNFKKCFRTVPECVLLRDLLNFSFGTHCGTLLKHIIEHNANTFGTHYSNTLRTLLEHIIEHIASNYIECTVVTHCSSVLQRRLIVFVWLGNKNNNIKTIIFYENKSKSRIYHRDYKKRSQSLLLYNFKPILSSIVYD